MKNVKDFVDDDFSIQKYFRTSIFSAILLLRRKSFYSKVFSTFFGGGELSPWATIFPLHCEKYTPKADSKKTAAEKIEFSAPRKCNKKILLFAVPLVPSGARQRVPLDIGENAVSMFPVGKNYSRRLKVKEERDLYFPETE